VTVQVSHSIETCETIVFLSIKFYVGDSKLKYSN
jgi:hypothetical protein